MQLQVQHNLTEEELCKALTGMAAASGIQEEVLPLFDDTGTSRIFYVEYDQSRNIVGIALTKRTEARQLSAYVDKNGITSPGGEQKKSIGQAAVFKKCHGCGKIKTYPPHKAAKLRCNPHMCVPCSLGTRAKTAESRGRRAICATGPNNPNYKGGVQVVTCSDCGKPRTMRPYEVERLTTKGEPYRCRICYEKAMPKGPESPIWMGGKNTEEYPEEFDHWLKERIRTRDGYQCRICGDDQSKQRRLDVHHIDYDKSNSDETNLIALCNRCHQRTNFQRKYWKARLTALMNNVAWEHRRVKR